MSLFIFGILLISLNLNSSTVEISKYNGNNTKTLLVKYGEQVFENEKCYKCHALNDEDAKWGKKSLEAFGGKRTSAMISAFLDNPKILYPKTRMPSFAQLQHEQLNKNTLKTVLSEDPISDTELEIAWKTINKQADELTKTINLDKAVEHKKSSQTALIAFLQSLP
ncbi:c-type cytochrome [Brumimicrobium oceani]|nr:c-type cytochrome [Brumimicrobium oceani]